MKTITAVAALSIAVMLPAKASPPLNVAELNEVIDQTNFIVARGCSGTLISKKYKLLLTAHHCVKGYIRNVFTTKVEGGEVKEEKR